MKTVLIQIFSLAIMLTVFQSIHFAYGAQTHLTHKILVTIGYTDHHDNVWQKIGFGSYEYVPGLAIISEDAFVTFLRSEGFLCFEKVEIAKVPNHHICRSGETEVMIMNSNVPCNGEDWSKPSVRRAYRSECFNQKKHSLLMKTFVEKNMFHFDGFVYLGHARGGQGLAFSNVSESIENIHIEQIYRQTMNKKLQLKHIILSSCFSKDYYSHILKDPFVQQTQITLHLTEGKLLWVDQMIPFALRQLKAILQDE